MYARRCIKLIKYSITNAFSFVLRNEIVSFSKFGVSQSKVYRLSMIDYNLENY